MEKVRLGKTEMMVSRFGFGGIPIQRPTEDEAVAVVKKCIELGINYFDTANAYTTSEERIGRAISGRREKIILATKTQSRSRENLERHLKLSLKQLAVKSIDLYQFHNVADAKSLETVLDPNGPMAVLEEAKKAGVIKHIGITSHTLEIAKEAVKTDRFETLMFPFNFVTSEAAEELLPLARKHDVGFIAMKPMGGGMLDNATIALKYLLQFPDVFPIVGIQSIDEVEELVRVAEGPLKLSTAEKREMKRIKDELDPTFCHRCEYCQPCTVGIQISTVMHFTSFFKRQPPESIFDGRFTEILEKAADCAECGDCEERCPYHLPIIKMIAEQYKWYQEEKKKYQERVKA